MGNVIVTGGSRGLGLGIAKALRSAGHDVIAVARSESEHLSAAMNDPESTGPAGSIRFEACDLGRVDELAAFVKRVRKTHGPIFGLVNNAGIGTSGMLSTMRDADIESLLRMNTLSPLMLTKYVVRSMMGGQGGRIVNIASIVGFTGYSGLSVYSSTKSSMVGFTRSLARELGPLDITVNAVAPGFVDTAMTADLGDQQRDQIIRRSALRRLAQSEDVAGAVEFLLSPRAKNITGTTMTVDAGNTA
ncbi:MAG TPA: SDR family oxidoreductase [Gemmatimonadaceae bacterium]|jgi:3-oxoacyl-[acyl-carrier protein] reductase|nr:SDR family oxidoreductase [Gemmatimonadaceae bacterium]